MNHFKLLSTALIAGMLTISACKKDNPEEPETTVTDNDAIIKTPTGKSCLLSGIAGIGYNGEGEATITYNTNDKVSKISFSEDGNLAGYMTFSYEDDKIILKEYSGDVLFNTETFNLDNGIVATSTSSLLEDRGGYTFTKTKNTSYEYNSDGYLTKKAATYTTTSDAPGFEKEVETQIQSYNYENGNLTLLTDVYTRHGANGRQGYENSFSRTYEYYTDKANTVREASSISFLTKANKNLIKKFTETGSGNYTATCNFTYEINDDGLVTKNTAVTGGDVPPSTKITTYDYSCD